MKRFSFRKVSVIILIVGAVVVTLLQTIYLCSFLVIGMEDTFRKWEIDNPYVDNRFRDCKKITLDTSHTICIPEDWSFEETDGIYRIYDQENNLWAMGTNFGTECDRFADSSEFFSTFVPLQDIYVTHESYPPISFMQGANISKKHVHGTDGSASYFYIYLMDITSGADTCFVLMDDIDQDAQSFNVAEALMYSFAWPNKTKCAQIT